MLQIIPDKPVPCREASCDPDLPKLDRGDAKSMLPMIPGEAYAQSRGAVDRSSTIRPENTICGGALESVNMPMMSFSYQSSGTDSISPVLSEGLDWGVDRRQATESSETDRKAQDITDWLDVKLQEILQNSPNALLLINLPLMYDSSDLILEFYEFGFSPIRDFDFLHVPMSHADKNYGFGVINLVDKSVRDSFITSLQGQDIGAELYPMCLAIISPMSPHGLAKVESLLGKECIFSQPVQGLEDLNT